MTTDFPGGRLTIDLGALADNWRTLRAISPASECAAVVKADAYGIGLAKTVGALAFAGARTFFVAHLSEARTVRSVAPEAAVYVLNGLPPGAAAAFAEAGVRPVLGSREEIAEWAAFTAFSGADPGSAIHVDTGMNRLGLTPQDFGDMQAAGGPGFSPSLVMSHLACADEPERPETARQRKLFAELRALVPQTPASLANSSGTLRPKTSEGDLAFELRRPGVSLYGANPIAGFPAPVKPVVRLEARIVQVRDLQEGDAVGYGGIERMSHPSRIAVLSLGYADGILRAGGGPGGATAYLGSAPCPYVGRISMDLIAIDVTGADRADARRGAWVEILGDNFGVDDLGRCCGTLGYEILTNLGVRFERSYV